MPLAILAALGSLWAVKGTDRQRQHDDWLLRLGASRLTPVDCNILTRVHGHMAQAVQHMLVTVTVQNQLQVYSKRFGPWSAAVAADLTVGLPSGVSCVRSSAVCTPVVPGQLHTAELVLIVSSNQLSGSDAAICQNCSGQFALAAELCCSVSATHRSLFWQWRPKKPLGHWQLRPSAEEVPSFMQYMPSLHSLTPN